MNNKHSLSVCLFDTFADDLKNAISDHSMAVVLDRIIEFRVKTI